MNNNTGGYQPISFEDDVEIGPQQGLREGKVLRVMDSSAPNSEIRFDNEPQILAENQAHIYFFGCCCDFRRAILSLSLVSIIVRLLTMLWMFLMTLYVNEQRAEVVAMFDDDEIKSEFEHDTDMQLVILIEILADLGAALVIIFDVIGIYGALKFKRWAIITSLTFYSINLVLAIYVLDLADGIVFCIYVYAYASMLKLMMKGIMIDENYHKIAGCCGKK